jgi:hypothetical protein
LYDELQPGELDVGRDSEFLHALRVAVLFCLCAFTCYIVISLFCLCFAVGINGNIDRNNARRNVRIFKRVPFG